jgi:hypothetical protein
VKSRGLWAVLELLVVVVSAASGQWLEATVFIPDSLGGLRFPSRLVYDSADNRVFVAGESTRTLFAFDATDGHGEARIPLGANVRALVPGVYFVREEPQAAGLKLVAIQKVLIVK